MMRARSVQSSLCIVWAIVCALSVLSVVGCGPRDAASLTGKVAFNGEPIAEGNIRLFATGGTASQGGAAPIVNGSYEIPASSGLAAGSYSVVITATRPATPEEVKAMEAADDESGDAPDEDESEEGTASQPSARKMQYIPEQYNQATTLTAELTAGANTKDFDLQP